MARFYVLLGVLQVGAWMGPFAGAQTPVHFTDCFFGTDNNATVILPVTSTPDVDGRLLNLGGEIAVFSTAGHCAGAMVWEGVATSMAVWGDDDRTPALDGMRAGEPLAYRVWDGTKEYAGDRVRVTYENRPPPYSSDGLYGDGKLFVVAALRVSTAPAVPVLAYPDNDAADVPINPAIVWRAAPRADAYALQLATEAGFSDLVVDQGSLRDTSYVVTDLAYASPYHWRVQARNADGESAWSSPYRFTTQGAGPTSNEPGPRLPEGVRRYESYPNPFRDGTTISFEVGRSAEVTLTVYDVMGRVVATIFSGRVAAGRYAVPWQARDVTKGVYLCRLSVDGHFVTRSLLVL